MDARAEGLIRALGLQPHPEGGYYAEVYRAAAVSTIYYLLPFGEKSRWHRVTSDEIWHFYEGAPLDLLQLTPDGGEMDRFVLGPLSEKQRPVHCVPADHWQAARSRGGYTLVGCTVAPAFQYANFSLLNESPSLVETILGNHPAAGEFV
jgi:predicted cupin superfamily sugar epimerase